MIVNKKKIYYWIGIALALNLVLIFLVIIPYYQKITVLKNQIQTNRQEIAEMEERRQILIESGRNYEILKNTDTEEVLGVLINREEVLEFINTLENLAEQEQVEQEIDINEESISKGDELLVNLNLQGDFDQLAKYLELLEEQNFYLDVKKAIIKKTVETTETEGVQEVMTVKLELKAYWQE